MINNKIPEYDIGVAKFGPFPPRNTSMSAKTDGSGTNG